LYNPAASLSPKSPSAAIIKRRLSPSPAALCTTPTNSAWCRPARSSPHRHRRPQSVAFLSKTSCRLVSSVGCSHAPYFYHGTLMITILALRNYITVVRIYYQQYREYYRPPRTWTGARPAARGGGCHGSNKYRHDVYMTCQHSGDAT